MSKLNALKHKKVNENIKVTTNEEQDIMIEKIELGRKKMSVADTNRNSFRDL